MKKYMSFKLVEAEPAGKEGNVIYTGPELHSLKENNPRYYELLEKGYQITCPDGYISFCPKDVFEKRYMQVDDAIKITQDNVDNFIESTEVLTMGKKNTVVRAILKNGFEIVESSACVDEKNYDEKYGAEICMGKIKDQIWKLLGFLLQTAKNGVDK